MNGSYLNETCELCLLEIRTRIYYENDFFIILDCKDCKVPMSVWKEHIMEIPEPDEYVMKSLLLEAGETIFGINGFYIDKAQKKIPNHLHWHARKKIKKSEKRA